MIFEKSSYTDPFPTPRFDDLESKKRKRITYSNLQFSITPIMCDFINRAHGTKISKTELEMIVLQYIKKQGLIKNNIISPNSKIKALLGIHQSFPLLILNDLIKQHYILH